MKYILYIWFCSRIDRDNLYNVLPKRNIPTFIFHISTIIQEVTNNELEKNAMRECNVLLCDNLYARDIVPILYSKYLFDEDQMENLLRSKSNRRDICQKVLLVCVKSCPFDAFLSRHLYDFEPIIFRKVREDLKATTVK